MGLGLVSAILISDICGIVYDGRELEELRSGVLRLHILANSDSDEDQQLKLLVRDAVLEHSGEIFGSAGSIEEAEENTAANLELICSIAEETLSEHGCDAPVRAELADMYFDERQYGDITMPEGEYRALRIELGEANGHNWWCVMYPQLCIPAACGDDVEEDKDKTEELFSDRQQDILYHPKKYRVKFAIWEKIKTVFDL